MCLFDCLLQRIPIESVLGAYLRHLRNRQRNFAKQRTRARQQLHCLAGWHALGLIEELLGFEPAMVPFVEERGASANKKHASISKHATCVLGHDIWCCLHINPFLLCVLTYLHPHANNRARIRTRTRAHARTHAHTHIWTQTQTHT